MTIGSVQYDVACRCVRCKLPNNDPETGVPDANQPLSTMYSYRRIDEGTKFGPCFGMNLVPLMRNENSLASAEDERIGTIRVGDEITVLEEGKHFYISQ